jgi:hypothetical protein
MAEVSELHAIIVSHKSLLMSVERNVQERWYLREFTAHASLLKMQLSETCALNLFGISLSPMEDVS